MAKVLRKIKELKDKAPDEIKEMAKDYETYHSLDVLAQSEGGKILIESHISDAVSLINSLATKYKKLSHIETIALCADLKTKLDVVRTLTRAKKNKAVLEEQLEQALQE